MISVVVPYRPDGGYRDRAWHWIEQRWRAMPDVELIVSEAGPGAHPGEFNHPAAINAGAERASGEVIIVADADVAFEPAWIRKAAGMVECGEAKWVLPSRYDHVAEAASEWIMQGSPLAPLPTVYAVEDFTLASWAGLVVVPRRAMLAVGGYDERFEWWGPDDVAFGVTMDALWGPHTRLEGRAVHLWHPHPLEHNYGHERHRTQQALADQYVAASQIGPDEVRRVRFAL